MSRSLVIPPSPASSLIGLQKFLWSIRQLQGGAGGLESTAAVATTDTGLAGELEVGGGAVGVAGLVEVLGADGGSPVPVGGGYHGV